MTPDDQDRCERRGRDMFSDLRALGVPARLLTDELAVRLGDELETLEAVWVWRARERRHTSGARSRA